MHREYLRSMNQITRILLTDGQWYDPAETPLSWVSYCKPNGEETSAEFRIELGDGQTLSGPLSSILAVEKDETLPPHAGMEKHWKRNEAGEWKFDWSTWDGYSDEELARHRSKAKWRTPEMPPIGGPAVSLDEVDKKLGWGEKPLKWGEMADRPAPVPRPGVELTTADHLGALTREIEKIENMPDRIHATNALKAVRRTLERAEEK
ncbi:hypothetical protein [Prescottella agglutinans]|uniref:Uncharacterized protein n=1 Tax=Prescottella agglutinans TaxID=1644129 RepID=A0ABT6MG05_9NOCA|nr:hypothetical protein [Prescottella agglutinans]MDH6283207.1 hypothetical protein [Prescottella agglutinans]